MKKMCQCREEMATYNDFGEVKCQYCTGLITDPVRLEKIRVYNTPVDKENNHAKTK